MCLPLVAALCVLGMRPVWPGGLVLHVSTNLGFCGDGACGNPRQRALPETLLQDPGLGEKWRGGPAPGTRLLPHADLSRRVNGLEEAEKVGREKLMGLLVGCFVFLFFKPAFSDPL